jgi:hypothetical protein
MSFKQLRADITDDPTVVLVVIDGLYELSKFFLGWL